MEVGMLRPRTQLQLEELGARLVPSTTPLVIPLTHPPATADLASATRQGLVGHGQGSYFLDVMPPDAGMEYHLQGIADLGTLGHVSVSGALHSVGFILHGRAWGTLTFRNAQGSVTVE